MRISKPPALATWMLEHLILGTDRDALAGDLLEEFRQGRSVQWYWRQVLAAIFLGFPKELGRQWKAAIFAFVWTIASLIALRVLYHSTQFRPMFGWALRHDWPESGILTTIVDLSPQFLMWWFGVCLYLLMMRSFTARRVARGVLISLFCMLLGLGFDLSGWGQFIHDVPQRLAIRGFGHWTPSFLALLLSLCATLPSRVMRRSVTAAD